MSPDLNASITRVKDSQRTVCGILQLTVQCCNTSTSIAPDCSSQFYTLITRFDIQVHPLSPQYLGCDMESEFTED
jgi:hypothetical protein